MERMNNSDDGIEKNNTDVSATEEKLRGIIYALSSDISDLYTVDAKTKMVYAYRMSGDARGVSMGLQQGMTYESLMETYISHNVYPADRNKMREFTEYKRICNELRNEPYVVFHYRTGRGDELHYYYLKCTYVGTADDFDTVIFAFGREDDTVNERNLIRSIEIDELTGLYTRQAFYHKAAQMLKDNPDVQYDITISDVANFKLVNSVYGEAMGDEIIKYLADFVKRNTVDGICARYGGDVFVGIAVSTPDRQKDWLLNMINQAKLDSPVPNINLKCGIYKNVDKELSIAAMCDRALFALKSIKNNYAMPYATYAGPIGQKHVMAQTYEYLFDKAIEDEEFIIYFQPKYDAVSEKIVSAEALVRWQMKDGKFISPGEFIPVFEESGLIARLDEYVFRKVAEMVRGWKEKNMPLIPISINLSRASAFQLGTTEKYTGMVEEIDIDPSLLPLELTESASIDNKTITEFMNELRDTGFPLHLDDFGSGVSSLSCFISLPFDEIKLDKTIIDSIGDEAANELLRHIVELAHFKNMKVVAEGVEEKEQLDFLKEVGCDIIQGFYFSRPLPYEEFVKYFEKELA